MAALLHGSTTRTPLCPRGGVTLSVSRHPLFEGLIYMAALLYPSHFPSFTLSPSPELEFLKAVAIFFAPPGSARSVAVP